MLMPVLQICCKNKNVICMGYIYYENKRGCASACLPLHSVLAILTCFLNISSVIIYVISSGKITMCNSVTIKCIDHLVVQLVSIYYSTNLHKMLFGNERAKVTCSLLCENVIFLCSGIILIL